MPLTPFPPAPSRGDPLAFADKADAWLAHFESPFIAEFNAAQADVNSKEASSGISASTATQAANTATEQAALANAFAQAAAVSAEVTIWSTAVSYTAGQSVFSPIDFHTYRRKNNGSGGADPSVNPNDWQKLTGVDGADYGFINTAATAVADYGAI
jgi:hypothetical protein